MKKNKKVLFVSSYYPPHTGGLEKYVQNIATGLRKTFGWDVVIVTTSSKTEKIKVEVKNNIKVYYLPRWFNLSNTPINPLWYFDLKRIIEKEKPSIVNAHAPVPFLADLAALASMHLIFVVTYHDGTMLKDKSFYNIPIFVYEKLILQATLAKARKIICSSDFIKNGFLKAYKNKTITINPGVGKIGVQAQNKSGKNVLFVSSLTSAQKHKGLEGLIKAIPLVQNNIKEVQLRVVGRGSAVNYYKKLAKDLKIEKRVYFIGALFGRELEKQYKQADVLVLPSSKESFGMVLIESMAQGTAVIGSKIGGIPDIITHEDDGFLVSHTDISEVSDAITMILQDRALAKKMGRKGQDKVKKKYLWDLQVKKTNQLFDKLLG